MNYSMLLGLVNNIAMLLALGLLYDTLALREKIFSRKLTQLLTGVVLGLMGIAVMMNHWVMTNGAYFDTRSILLSIAGLFFGPLPTIIAVALTSYYRYFIQGGVGALTGVIVIISSGSIGIAWRQLRNKPMDQTSSLELYFFGVVVHVNMLFWMLTFPGYLRWQVLSMLSLPVLTLYPVGTALLGWLMVGRIRHKRAEENLAESESRYRSLFENNHMPMLILDPEDGRIVDANPIACAYYGWPAEKMRTMTASEINTLSPEAIKTEMQNAISESRNHFYFKHRRADGSICDVEVYSGPIQIEGRKLLYSIIADITARKKAEAELRESDGRFRNLVENAPIPIFIRTGTTFAYLNAAAVRTLGAESADQLLGTTVMERIAPAYRETVRERVRSLDELRKPVPLVEEDFLKIDGTPFPAEVSAVPFKYEGRLGSMVFFRDITDRKQAEAQRLHMERQIQQSQKLESLGVLAGGIAHDFNNILMAVLGHADLALSELPPMSPARESLREIEQAARRAAELCRQMLAYSGRGKFVIETIHVRELIDEMIHLLKTTISKKVLLNLNLEKHLPPMRGDATQIRQVLMNLVINASEAIGERSGVITISTGAQDCTREYLSRTYLDEELTEGLYIWLEVSDTGCGMDKDTQSRIFEPFFTTKFTGRGLGMAAVLGIVRGHKGAMKVYSELGRGTTFKVLFPAVLDETLALSRKNAGEAPDWKSSGTVLLADDEETIRALGKKMLGMLGFTVLVAKDGMEAIELYRAHQDEISLVLLDLTMPRINGEEAFRELRLINPTARVVLSSGYTESEIISRFAGKGVAGFVQKPYTMMSLREALRSVLEAESTK